jgi:hypothetical protein
MVLPQVQSRSDSSSSFIISQLPPRLRLQLFGLQIRIEDNPREAWLQTVAPLWRDELIQREAREQLLLHLATAQMKRKTKLRGTAGSVLPERPSPHAQGSATMRPRSHSSRRLRDEFYGASVTLHSSRMRNGLEHQLRESVLENTDDEKEREMEALFRGQLWFR